MAASFVPNFDALNCALCLKDMTERTPRALDCLHTFCECCLLELPVTMVTQAHFLQCPTCKTFTRLPQDGVAGLKVNFILAEIGNQLKVQRMTLCEQKAAKTLPGSCTDHQKELMYFCTECCLVLCEDCRSTDIHISHKECVKSYAEGLDEIVVSLGSTIQEEIGLCKVWNECVNNDMPEVRQTENSILKTEGKLKDKIGQSVSTLQHQVAQSDQNLTAFMNSMKITSSELDVGYQQLQDIHQVDRAEVGSVIAELKASSKKSRIYRLQQKLTFPVFEEKIVLTEKFLDLDLTQKVFDYRTSDFPNIYVGKMSSKLISTPHKFFWTDHTDFYDYEPKLVNASDKILVVNTDNSIFELTRELQSNSKFKHVAKEFKIVPAEPENSRSRSGYGYHSAPKKVDLPDPKSYSPKAVNSLMVCQGMTCLVENDGRLHMVKVIDRIMQVNIQQVYGGILEIKSQKPRRPGEYETTYFLNVLSRKNGTIVEWNHSDYRYQREDYNPGQQQKVHVIASGLEDPVKLTRYKETSKYIVVGCSSHKIYILNKKGKEIVSDKIEEKSSLYKNAERSKTQSPKNSTDHDIYEKLEILYSFGEYGEGKGQFNHPYDVAVTHYGTLLVADTNNYRITEYSITGEFLRTLISFKREREKVYSLSYNINQQQLWVVVQGQRRRLLCCDFMSD